MTRFYLYCGRSSEGGAALIKGLGGKRIKNVGSKYRHRRGDVVINWGSTHTPFQIPYVNDPHGVSVAVSKIKTFEVLKANQIPCPDVTLDLATAVDWNKNSRVLGRDLDNGSQGRGITVYDKATLDLTKKHKFFVKYYKKEREFRFHVLAGQIIFAQEKMKKADFNDNKNNNKYVRSHNRGWVLAFNHLQEKPYPVEGLAEVIGSVAALGLDFGAVDCGWNKDKGYCVFEVNTAPGIENSTLAAYIDAFKGI